MANLNKGDFKSPRAVNVVSVACALAAAWGIYWLICFGPAWLAFYQVKMTCKEAAAKFYKLQYLESSVRNAETTKVVEDARKEIVQTLGFNDPEMTVKMMINEETKAVNVVAEYDHMINLIGVGKKRVVHYRAVGESDFKPNNW